MRPGTAAGASAFLLRILLMIFLPALLFPGNISARVTAGTMEEARLYCDRNELVEPEGIWEFPEDETRVLVIRDPGKAGAFDIIILTTPDCRLEPGERIGYLRQSADSRKFRLTLFVRRNFGILSDPRSCLAEFRETDNSMFIHPRKLKISFRTLWFLPRFWRSLKIRIDDPAADIPHGLTRIYPLDTPKRPVYL